MVCGKREGRHWAQLDRKNVPEGRLQFTISHCPFYKEVEENLKMTKTKRL